MHTFVLWKAICHLSSGVTRWTPAGRYFECARTSASRLIRLAEADTPREVSAVTYADGAGGQVPEPMYGGCRWRAAPPTWSAGRHDGEASRISLDEAGVVVRWRLQRVRACGRAAPGTGAEPAQDGVFPRTRKQTEGSGGGKRGRKARSCSR